jgi:hypothetical protein
VEILLAEGLQKEITEFHQAKDAVIALFPETANNKQPVWANAWKIANGKWRKEGGVTGTPGGDDDVDDGVDGHAEFINAESVQPPPISPPYRTETAGRGAQGAVNVTVIVPPNVQGRGTSPGRPLLPGGKGVGGDGAGKNGDGKPAKASGKGLHEFIKPLIKGGICYQGLRSATEKWNSKANLALLETVKDIILGMQKDLMPGKLIKMRLKTDFGAEFTDLVDGIEALKGPNGALPKGWERQNLPVISTNQPPQGMQQGAFPPGKGGFSAPNEDPFPSTVKGRRHQAQWQLAVEEP